MILVVDTNILISCLISESEVRKIIASSGFEFYMPDFVLSEIDKHRELILEKSGLEEDKLKDLIDNIFSFTIIIPEEEYRANYKKAKKIMGKIDNKTPKINYFIVFDIIY